MLLDARGNPIKSTSTSARLQRRSYHAGMTDRLTNDWIPNTMTPDKAISDHIQTLRDRARQLEKDNRYVKRWLSSLENNCLGADGINLQMKVRFSTGRFDKGANDKIEAAWAKWGEQQNCSINREDSWVEMQRLILRSAARDGGILIRIVRGRDVNPFAFALDLIEIDLMDVRYTEALPNGNEVRLGVERNRLGQVVAFHSAHKLQLMAHSTVAYRELGRLVADLKQIPRAAFREQYESGFMAALSHVATRGRNANVLQHAAGHLKTKLDSASRTELAELIHDYRKGLVPLVVPVTLMGHFVRIHEIDYLQGQVFLEPHPKELMLRNHV